MHVLMPMLTQAEFVAYRLELERLRTIRDRDLPALMREVRTFVASDAAEEVLQIHDDAAFVAARIGWLEELLDAAHVVVDHVLSEVATVGGHVEVEYLATGKVVRYRIAGVPNETAARTVSAASPIGRALLGHAPGDIVSVELPRGRVEDIRILAVTTAEAQTPDG